MFEVWFWSSLIISVNRKNNFYKVKGYDQAILSSSEKVIIISVDYLAFRTFLVIAHK